MSIHYHHLCYKTMPRSSEIDLMQRFDLFICLIICENIQIVYVAPERTLSSVSIINTVNNIERQAYISFTFEHCRFVGKQFQGNIVDWIGTVYSLHRLSYLECNIPMVRRRYCVSHTTIDGCFRFCINVQRTCVHCLKSTANLRSRIKKL